MAALGYFWWVRGYYSEARRFLEELVGHAQDGSTSPRTRALALSWLGVLLVFQGEKSRARAVLNDALGAARSADDPRTLTVSLLCLGLHAKVIGEWARSAPWLEEAIEVSRRAGDGWGAARSKHDLGITALYGQDHAKAERLLGEARAGHLLIGDERSMAEALLWLGMAARKQGDASRAVALVRGPWSKIGGCATGASSPSARTPSSGWLGTKRILRARRA